MDSGENYKSGKIICICIPCLNLGGTEIQTLNLVRVLKSKNFIVTVLCYFEYELTMLNRYMDSGVDVDLIGLKRNIGVFQFVRILINKFRLLRPDIAHIQYLSPGALPIIAARLAGVKTVYATVHQPYTELHGKLAKFFLRSASLLSNRFIAVSQNAEFSWFGSSHLFNENLPLRDQPNHFTIHNAVDINTIDELLNAYDREKLKEQLKIKPESVIFGIVSRLRYEKGVDIFLDAAQLLQSEFNNAHFLIVGDGPDKVILLNKVIQKGIMDFVTFTGGVEWEKAIQFIGIIDIVVVPSRFEGFGLTASESMAAEKPVIASDSFGLKEVVVNEGTGLLFSTGDVNMLKEHMLKLCRDRVLRNYYGKNGRKRCESVFGLKSFTTKISALYS